VNSGVVVVIIVMVTMLFPLLLLLFSAYAHSFWFSRVRYAFREIGEDEIRRHKALERRFQFGEPERFRDYDR